MSSLKKLFDLNIASGNPLENTYWLFAPDLSVFNLEVVISNFDEFEKDVRRIGGRIFDGRYCPKYIMFKTEDDRRTIVSRLKNGEY